MEISVVKLFKVNKEGYLLAFADVQLVEGSSIINCNDISLMRSKNGKANWLAFPSGKYVDSTGVERYKVKYEFVGNIYYRLLEHIQSVYDGKEQTKARVMVKNGKLEAIENMYNRKENITLEKDIPF